MVKLGLKIKCLSSLEQACKSLGLTLAKNKTSYRWWGHHVGDHPLPEGFTAADLGKCEHAIQVTGDSSAYEMGVVKSKDGDGYELLYDFYGAAGQKMMVKVGKNGGLLKQAYTIERAKRVAKLEDYEVTVTTRADGTKIMKVMA